MFFSEFKSAVQLSKPSLTASNETIENANANDDATTENPIVECHDSFDTACNSFQ